MDKIDNEAEETEPDLEDEAKVPDHEEFYVPKRPITFDKTGKFLIYESKDDKSMKWQYGLTLTFSLIPQYCLVRAIMRMSWWRILLWSVPSALILNLQRNSLYMVSRIIT